MNSEFHISQHGGTRLFSNIGVSGMARSRNLYTTYTVYVYKYVVYKFLGQDTKFESCISQQALDQLVNFLLIPCDHHNPKIRSIFYNLTIIVYGLNFVVTIVKILPKNYRNLSKKYLNHLQPIFKPLLLSFRWKFDMDRQDKRQVKSVKSTRRQNHKKDD